MGAEILITTPRAAPGQPLDGSQGKPCETQPDYQHREDSLEYERSLSPGQMKKSLQPLHVDVAIPDSCAQRSERIASRTKGRDSSDLG